MILSITITNINLSKTNIWSVMNKFTPFLRYINKTDFMPNNDFTIAYDCRMLYILEGEGVLNTEFGNYELKPDTFAYYPSGIKYFPLSNEGSRLKFITVNFDFNDIHEDINETLSPVSCNEFSILKEFPSYHSINDELFHKPFTIDNAVFLKNNLLRLYDAFQSDSIYSKDISSTILKLCILEILKFNTHKVSNQLVEEIKSYIIKNCSTISSNADIANHFKYHEYYLNNLFKAHTDTTIHKFIIDTRIKKAEEELSYSDLSISEVAADCGFVNADHFSRLFKEKKGISPNAFRKNSKNI